MNKKEEIKVDYRRAAAVIWEFIGPVYKPVWWILIFLIMSVGLTLIEPNIYRLVIDVLSGGVEADAAGAGEASVNFVYVFSLLGIWAGVSVLNLIFFSIFKLIFTYRLAGLEKFYYQKALDIYFNQDVSKHLAKKSGESLKKIDKANDGIWSATGMIGENILTGWLSALAMIAMGFYFSWQMTLVTLLMIPVYIFVFGYAQRKTGDLQDEIMQEYDKFWGNAHDAASNMMAVKSFAREKFHLKKLMGQMMDVSTKQKKISLRWGAIDVSSHFLAIFNRMVIFSGGVFLFVNGFISFGTIIMFLSMSGMIYAPLYQFGQQLRNLQKWAVNINEADKLFNEVRHVNDKKGAKKLKISKGEIELRSVSFKYEHLGIIKDVSFKVEAGEMTALVGHSGAGKSTLASLISRFYDVNEGAILIDGQDLRDITLESLRNNIGMVMQDNTMFNDTVFNNILYAKPEASLEEVKEAAKAANIHDFIMEQEKGYETLVGERGLKLSGGQRQRIAIARVILKNPPLLILDEATSALDSVSEKVVQEALEKVMKGRTSIVIAHRLSTVRKADKIIVLDKGKLVQEGNHNELMKVNGIYKELVDLQVNGLLAK